MSAAATLLLAMLLDLLFGDPLWLPHPVRAIGAAYAALDALADRWGRTRILGAGCVLLVGAASAGGVWGVSHLPGVGVLFTLYFAYAGLALGGLLREGRRAARFLEQGNLDSGRQVVAGLVSRDVSGLDMSGLWRTLAETMAENTNDAFVAPLFWLAIAGPAGLWAYKAVSTADSMWGYRTPRYRSLGWFGAKADDVLAWLPARLTALCLWLSGRGFRGKQGLPFRRIVVDAQKSASPNAGWPMAAAAWMCGGAMGGPAIYFGVTVDKPRLGPSGQRWDARRFALLTRLVLFSSGIVAIVTVLLQHVILWAFL